MIKCPNCTAQLAFEVNDQKIKCDYCGSSFEPSELRASLNVASEKDNPEAKETVVQEIKEEIEATSYNCDNCGATLLVYDDTAVTFCNYCGSSNVIKSKLIKQTKPDFIIPFEINKEKCIDLYKRKIKSNIFAPRHMLDDVVVNNFRGIYMPYEIYNFTANPRLVCSGRKYYKTVGNYDYYHIYTITGDIDGYVKGLSYDAVSRFHDKYSEAIGPFDYSKRKEFNPAYIAGFYADSIDVSGYLYQNEADVNAELISRNILKKDKRFVQYGCSAPKADMELSERKVAMYPVYFLGMRDKNNKSIYYAVVNGQSGKVAIDIPIDYKRYIIVSLILAAILFFVFQGLTLDIFVPIYFSMGAAVISFILGRVLTSNINKNKSLENDKGYLNKNCKNTDQTKNKVKGDIGIISIICPIIAFVLPFLVLISSITADIFFYGAAIVSCILVLISFYDVVVKYNELSKNKIPQLEKRGGDN